MPGTVMSRPLPRSIWLAIGLGVSLLVATLLLWAHYGAAVFFETIRAGFVACFG